MVNLFNSQEIPGYWHKPIILFIWFIALWLISRYVMNFERRRIIKDQLFTAILKEVDQTGVKIQLASAMFELTSLPELSINHKKD